jgi:hypothetical protein
MVKQKEVTEYVVLFLMTAIFIGFLIGLSFLGSR